MQLLFQFDVAKQSINELLETYWSNLRENVDEDVRRYATGLVCGTLDHLNEIDEAIARHAKHWRLERMASVDRNILRLAAYELLYQPETPKIVVIDEAVEIARRYSSYEATQFINALLDALRLEIEQRTEGREHKTEDRGSRIKNRG
jgi:N utilization substance protein B